MAYDYYDCDEGSVDPHYNSICGEIPIERARLRMGAWIHKSVVASIMANPTLLAPWTAAKASGNVILLPELSGSFDGGTPKIIPGYGNVKDKYSGADFKATINDPMYKENWAHYRSLVGKTGWHFAYCSESQIHITDNPVTIAPKNPIGDNMDDAVVWSSEVTWSQFFTPAPHDIPDGLFAAAA